MSTSHNTVNEKKLSSVLDINSAEFNPNMLLSPMETSIVLGVAEGTLSVWRSAGRYGLVYIKCGRLVKYRVCDVLNFLHSRKVEAKSGERNEI